MTVYEDELKDYIQPERYDLAYSWYAEDIPFYVARAREARGPVLEVACGTGRVLIPTLQTGVDIDGLDLHPGMLDVTKGKARALGLAPRLVLADMRDFTMPRRYALVTIPFRAFMHLYDTTDQLRALRCIREHLEPGGALVFDVFHPNFRALVEPQHEVHGDRRVTDPTTGLEVVLHTVTTEVDRVNQTLRVERELQELGPGGEIANVTSHRFRMRWTYKAEMELLLGAAGLARFDVRGGFDGRPLLNDTDEMIWTAWKD